MVSASAGASAAEWGWREKQEVRAHTGDGRTGRKGEGGAEGLGDPRNAASVGCGIGALLKETVQGSKG